MDAVVAHGDLPCRFSKADIITSTWRDATALTNKGKMKRRRFSASSGKVFAPPSISPAYAGNSGLKIHGAERVAKKRLRSCS
jgi:hypothetical protein